MAVAEPDDVNEIFRRMTEDLDLDVSHVPEFTVSSLTDLELVENFNSTKRELYSRGEMLNATTPTGRDLQSKYHALLLQMKKRGLQ